MSIQKFSINEVKYEIEKISEKYRIYYIDEIDESTIFAKILLSDELESIDLAKQAAIDHFEKTFA
ncbi:TPA: hypothetical protein DIU22_00825 [Candidatus Woesebacteria bacterium]|nr:MAG: hypothetical protein UR41_C0020G0011 [Candidatus Woesebacteria bacterium GW2011_GWA1_33_33]HCR35576.1 hypothetical protein [Candidatus Woesebacteria bacterium]